MIKQRQNRTQVATKLLSLILIVTVQTSFSIIFDKIAPELRQKQEEVKKLIEDKTTLAKAKLNKHLAREFNSCFLTFKILALPLIALKNVQLEEDKTEITKFISLVKLQDEGTIDISTCKGVEATAAYIANKKPGTLPLQNCCIIAKNVFQKLSSYSFYSGKPKQLGEIELGIKEEIKEFKKACIGSYLQDLQAFNKQKNLRKNEDF